MKAIVREMTSRGYRAEIVTVTKNGVELTGITVNKGNEVVSPVFYKDFFWDSLSAREVADILEANYRQVDKPHFDVNLIEDENFLRKHVQLCVQPKGNEDIIKRNYLDLEVYLRCVMTDGYSFKVKPEMEIEGLFECAVENTKGNFTADNIGPMMCVVTNTDCMFGASFIYYTDIFRDFCKANDLNGCFIIPSSIHEIILVPDDNISSKGKYDAMVRDANVAVVEDREYLADHAYYYSVAENNITW